MRPLLRNLVVQAKSDGAGLGSNVRSRKVSFGPGTRLKVLKTDEDNI